MCTIYVTTFLSKTFVFTCSYIYNVTISILTTLWTVPLHLDALCIPYTSAIGCTLYTGYLCYMMHSVYRISLQQDAPVLGLCNIPRVLQHRLPINICALCVRVLQHTLPINVCALCVRVLQHTLPINVCALCVRELLFRAFLTGSYIIFIHKVILIQE